MKSDRQAKCPSCGKRGGVTAQRDAYVNHSIAANGKIDWSDFSDVTVFDVIVYECKLCCVTIDESAVKSANRFEIN